MAEEFFTHTLANGVVLLGQRMPGVSSASMTVLLPAGASHDPDGAEGAAAVTADWVLRGAGGRSSRELNDALDALGCQHDESPQSEHIQLMAAQLGRNLSDVLALYADIVRRPALSDEAFEPCRGLALQDLASLEDEPARKCNLLLRERFYPRPLGRCIYGHEDSLRAMSPGPVREHVRARFRGPGTIVAVAGNIDWDAFARDAEKAFGELPGDAPPPVETKPPDRGVTHIAKQSAQTHLALAHPAATVSDERYYAARMAQAVLSDGMASRLFTEVREKRGLVYHVSSRYHSLRGHAGMFTYAGTRPEVAQQTFDVTVGELRRLAEGIRDEEMARAKTQLRSALIMQGQSTGARASAIAGDWYHLGRIRSLDEIQQAVEAVTEDEVMAYLKDFPAAGFTVLVIGPDPIDPGRTTEG